MLTIRCNYAKDVAIESDKSRYLIVAPIRSDFKERVLVGHQVDRFAHVERCRSFAVDDCQEFFFTPIH